VTGQNINNCSLSTNQLIIVQLDTSNIQQSDNNAAYDILYLESARDTSEPLKQELQKYSSYLLN